MMTKSEFIRSVPDIIDHKSWGYGELEIIYDGKRKGCCYRHSDNAASGGSYGSTWDEILQKLNAFLETQGYVRY